MVSIEQWIAKSRHVSLAVLALRILAQLVIQNHLEHCGARVSGARDFRGVRMAKR